MEEIYKPISNCEINLISNYGNVKNVKTQKVRKQRKGVSGYYYITLNKKNIRKCELVHRLVFIAFNENITEYDVIDHIDGNKLNNNIQNLRGTTFSENTKNAFVNNEKMKNKLIKVSKYDENMDLIKMYDSINDCARDNNFSRGEKITRLSISKKIHNQCYYQVHSRENEPINIIHYDDEEFKVIDEFFGYNYSKYSISNYGRIRVNRTQQIMSNTQAGDDYNRIKLFDDNKKVKKYVVHRIVAYFFISKYDANMVINHLDENKLNNFHKNLEITTCKKNIRYSLAKPIIKYDLHMNKIKEYSCIKDAANELNLLTSANIVKCCRNNIKTAYGFIWKYNNVNVENPVNLIVI